ncbi:hypothetical protein L0F63_004602 [Massospora cicadina]|nr:hypothetical protein L0F63_004602 [Massospora cicadina]
MVLFGVVTPQEAFASISGGTMLLLVGLMIILAKLEEKMGFHGAPPPPSQAFALGAPSPRSLLIRVSLLSALLGAFIMNDGAALFLTSIVMEIVEEHDLHVEPFALAVVMRATSANIGSASTVLGNPKNMLVQEKVPGLDFGSFFKRMGPPSILATLLNTSFLVLYYWQDVGSLSLIKPAALCAHYRRSFAEEDTDADVLAMQQEYLASKLNEDEEVSALGYLPTINETTPLKENAPSYCSRYTETPKNYSFGSSSSRSEEGFPALPPLQAAAGDSQSSASSIMSPALSFSDMPDFNLGTIPNYHWPSRDEVRHRRPKPSLLPPPLINEPESMALPRPILEHSTVASPESGESWFNSVQCNLQEHLRPMLIGLTLMLMYVGFILRWDLGWTCLAAAMVVLFLDGQDASRILSDHINWSLLCYLFGVPLCQGTSGVNFSPLINPHTPNLPLATLSFAILVVFLSFLFTSIPTVLLVSPYIPDLSDSRFARSACVAGLIVSVQAIHFCANPDFLGNL